MIVPRHEGRPLVGVAYSARIPPFLREYSTAVDYVEVPFELLRHDPSVIAVADQKPIVLHCATMSIAGTIPPTEQTVGEIRHWIDRTNTPWLGEHLSFITADRAIAGDTADEYAPGEPFNIGYTVSPAMNEGSLKTVLESVDRCNDRFRVPLLLENAPLYFVPPGSTMGQTEFIRAICEHSTVGLLLDLAHFYITSRTVGFDPEQELSHLPLQRVVEVHVSGVDFQEGMHWDNHASRAPAAILDLLATLLRSSDVQRVTLEYNWSTAFPAPVLAEEIARVRRVIDANWGDDL